MQPANPKIYHIVHIDKLESIIKDDCLWSDAEVINKKLSGTSIGMSNIKIRRLKELTLSTYSDLFVGECVPFYFCPRSVMLFLIHKSNHPGLTYHGGQDDIIHLEADLFKSIHWAKKNNRRWVFTFSNAGSSYFEDSNDEAKFAELNWTAIYCDRWNNDQIQEAKQSEFLCESSFSWNLIEKIGVNTQNIYDTVKTILRNSGHRPEIELKNEWYY